MLKKLFKFTNVEVATRIFLCLVVTHWSGESSFSQVKLIRIKRKVSDILQKIDCEHRDFYRKEILKETIGVINSN